MVTLRTKGNTLIILSTNQIENKVLLFSKQLGSSVTAWRTHKVKNATCLNCISHYYERLCEKYYK